MVRAVFFLALTLSAQHGGPRKANLSPRLWPGYGQLNFELSTAHDGARQWANQGLRLIYAFNHPEAAASFRRATELDPQCALCWWGLGLALGNNINAPLQPENARPAWEATQKGLALREKATPREAALLDALSKRYLPDNPQDRSSLDLAYADAMRRLARSFPDDLDIQTLTADALMNLTPWKLWSRDGKPNRYTLELVALLEGVLQRDPMHMGANHMYIHAVEASPTPERALASADLLAGLAPESGHLVHMPAHIYQRTGDYAKSAAANRKAAALDKAYFTTVGSPTWYTPYWYHNLHFLSSSLTMLGRYAEARDAIIEAARELDPVARLEQGLEASLAMPWFTEVRFAQWERILAAPEPASFSLTVNNVWRFARAMAYAAKAKLPEAQRERELFAKAVAALSPERGFGLNQELAIMRIAMDILDARIAWSAGRREEAITLARRAVASEDQLNYDEPAGWYYPPTRESLGAMLLHVARAAEAEAVFRAELENNRRSGRALFGRWQSLLAQDKKEAAAQVKPLYEQAWRLADRPLTLDHLF